MQDLRVIGVENGALLVASDDGERYRIAIDEVLQSKLRQTIPDPGAGRKLAPREIQAHIRSGMSAQDVASITGVPLEYIQRFEGPVLAEREYVVSSALAVPVHTAADTSPIGGSTFGTAIRERLYELGAINERWASWKEIGGGWIVKLSFTADQIDHDARWKFEPKKSTLAPLNNEAISLSQQGELTGPLVPRLRAVGDSERVADQSRFDSGAFSDRDLAERELISRSSTAATSNIADISPYGRLTDAPPELADAAINRAPVDEPVESNQTADLLEALRRRRGEREAASFDDESFADSGSRAVHPSTGSIRLVDVPMPAPTPMKAVDDETPGHTSPQPTALPTGSPARSKKGRAAMPSWDDIVFGARSDDE